MLAILTLIFDFHFAAIQMKLFALCCMQCSMQCLLHLRVFQVDVTNRSSTVDLSHYVYSGEWELLHVSVQVCCYPNSELEYQLSWRSQKSIKLIPFAICKTRLL